MVTGFGDPIPFSAVHGNGIDELYERIKIETNRNFIVDENKENNFTQESSIKIALIGKPNTGKSTLVNKLLGYKG